MGGGGNGVRATPHVEQKWRVCGSGSVHGARAPPTTVVTFDRGQRIRTDLDEWIQYQIFLTGYYDVETRATRLFRKVVQPGMTVIDVGANVGYYTLQAAARVGPAGRVHAFEPAGSTFTRLVENVELNGFKNVSTCRAIVNDRPGRLPLFVAPPDNSGLSGLRPPPGALGFEEVDALTLDDYCERTNVPRVDVVKIDVEGSELAVLRGMPRLLAQPQVQVFMEISAPNLAAAGARPADLVDLLHLRLSCQSGRRWSCRWTPRRSPARNRSRFSGNRPSTLRPDPVICGGHVGVGEGVQALRAGTGRSEERRPRSDQRHAPGLRPRLQNPLRPVESPVACIEI